MRDARARDSHGRQTVSITDARAHHAGLGSTRPWQGAPVTTGGPGRSESSAHQRTIAPCRRARDDDRPADSHFRQGTNRIRSGWRTIDRGRRSRATALGPVAEAIPGDQARPGTVEGRSTDRRARSATCRPRSTAEGRSRVGLRRGGGSFTRPDHFGAPAPADSGVDAGVSYSRRKYQTPTGSIRNLTKGSTVVVRGNQTRRNWR